MGLHGLFQGWLHLCLRLLHASHVPLPILIHQHRRPQVLPPEGLAVGFANVISSLT
jgi:hypothetical protein